MLFRSHTDDYIGIIWYECKWQWYAVFKGTMGIYDYMCADACHLHCCDNRAAKKEDVVIDPVCMQTQNYAGWHMGIRVEID